MTRVTAMSRTFNASNFCLWLLTASSLGAVGCGSNASASADPSPSPSPRVQVVVAEQGVVQPSLQIAGVISPYRQVGVASTLVEPIAEVDVLEGRRVRAGQQLARLITDDLDAQLASAEMTAREDTARFSQTAYQTTAVTQQDEMTIDAARSSLQQTRVSLAGALTDLKRYESLAGSGYVASQTVDEQRTTVANDQQAVRSAQASLDSAIANARANGTGANAGEQRENLAAAQAQADAARASVDQLRAQIGRARILAPVDGIVDAVNANPGEYPSGRELFTIEQLEPAYALLSASSPQVVNVRTGTTASIVVAGSQRREHGMVDAVLDQLQPGTTNFTVKVLLPNADDALHAGMPVMGYVDVAPSRGIVVPVSAYVDDSRTSVYTLLDGVVHVTRVTEVANDGVHAVVSGLAAGTDVVKDSQNADVGNGDRITAVR